MVSFDFDVVTGPTTAEAKVSPSSVRRCPLVSSKGQGGDVAETPAGRTDHDTNGLRPAITRR